MIKPRTYVKVLKHIGIALIAMPEPITTPIGIGLFLAGRYLAKSLEAGVNRRLQESIKFYLVRSRPVIEKADTESRTTRPDKTPQPEQRTPDSLSEREPEF